MSQSGEARLLDPDSGAYADVERNAERERPLTGFLSERRLVRARPTLPDETDRTPPTDQPSIVQPSTDRTGTGRTRAWLTGTGTPAALPGRSGPSTLLETERDVLLVDCGNGAGYQMARLGFGVQDLTHVFVTHHHFDHNVDLPYLLLSGWVSHRDDYRAPRIVGPPGTAMFVDRLLALQEYDARARLDHGYEPDRLAPEVIEVSDGTTVSGEGWTMTAFRVDHHPVCEAFGYRLDTPDVSLAISGDTKPCDNLVRHARKVDVLIHEALYPGYGYPDYHTASTQVGAVAARAEAARLVLTHLIPGDLPDERWIEHVRADYAGPLAVGHDLMPVVVGA